MSGGVRDEQWVSDRITATSGLTSMVVLHRRGDPAAAAELMCKLLHDLDDDLPRLIRLLTMVISVSVNRLSTTISDDTAEALAEWLLEECAHHD